MAFSVELKQPDHGKPFTVVVKKPEGYVRIGQDEDYDSGRYYMAFYEESKDEKESVDTIEYSCLGSDGGIEHWGTAFVIVGVNVVASDRRRIKDGREKGD